MQNTIFSKIQAKYSTFSPTHKKIADYICQNYIEMTYQSISEISKKIGVSTGSITNFCKVMDYKGFQQLHEELRRVAKDEIFPLRDIQDSITSQSLGEGAQLLQQVLDMNISNLQATFTDHLEQNFTIALNQLRKARNIYILGLRSCYALSYYFYFMLQDIGFTNVHLLSLGTGDIFDQVAGVRRGDLIFSISFQTYTQATCDVTAYFLKRGAASVALTDLQSAPIAHGAKAVLIAKNTTSTFSYVSPITILNALVTGLGRSDQEKTMRCLEEKKALLQEQHVHLM